MINNLAVRDIDTSRAVQKGAHSKVILDYTPYSILKILTTTRNTDTDAALKEQ